MSSKWTKATIADVLELVIDHRGKTPKKLGFDDFHCSGYPVLSAKHVKTSGLTSLDSIRYANESMYNKWMKVPLQKGDVILTSEAPMGETYYIDGSVQYLLGQRVFGLRPKQELIEPLYLLSWLSSQVGQSKLKERATGSTVQGIKQSELLKVEIELPPLFVQRAIAVNQSSISEKIQLNSKINQTLEQMAQAIFKSWFIDFDPVKAKIAALEAGGSEDDALIAAMQVIAGGALFATDAADADAQTQLARLQAEHPKQYNTLRATAELFPSAMQESELGEIPEGWRASKLSDEFDVTMGQSPPGHTYNEAGDGVPFFQGRRDFGVRYPSNRVYCTEPKRMAKAEDTLLSVRAPVGDTNLARTDCCIGRGIAALRHKSGCSSFTYYSVIQLGQALSSYDSEGTVFGSINQKNLNSLLVIAPSKEILSVFSQIVGATDSRIKSLSEEVSTLAELRDTLLPKLLSGELTIPDAESQLAASEEAAHV